MSNLEPVSKLFAFIKNLFEKGKTLEGFIIIAILILSGLGYYAFTNQTTQNKVILVKLDQIAETQAIQNEKITQTLNTHEIAIEINSTAIKTAEKNITEIWRIHNKFIQQMFKYFTSNK